MDATDSIHPTRSTPHPREAAPTDRWGLVWPGKRAARRAARTPTHTHAVPAPAESCDFARTAHLIIEGDNLDALKLLLPTFRSQVRLIYIDPPYNTGNTFIYDDKLRAHAVHDGGRDARSRALGGANRTERAAHQSAHQGAHQGGRSSWVEAHATWLSMLYPRLLLARELLRPDGALCLSIGEEEVQHARMLLDEIFGEEQHRNTIAVRRYDKNLSRQFMAQGLPSLAVGFEYILVYARGPEFLMRPIFRPASAARRERGYWKGFWNAADRPTMRYPLLGATPQTGQWKWRAEVAQQAVANYAAYLRAREERPDLSLEAHWRQTGSCLRFIRRNATGRGLNQGVEHWIPPSGGILRTSNWTDHLASESLRALDLPFDMPKRVALLKDVLRLCADAEAIILDFFAGSGSTGQAVLELNAEDGGHRRLILVQRPEPTNDPRYPTIAEITKERLRRVIADLRQRLEPPMEQRHDAASTPGEADLPDLGFRVLKLVAPPDGDGRAE